MSPLYLLAQRDNWERLGDRFSGRSADLDLHELGVLLLAMVGAAALIWLLHRLAKWQEGRAQSHNPKRLMRDLCRAHRLHGGEVKMLRSLAEAGGLKEVAEVFVRPDMFAADKLPKGWEARREELGALHHKLFTELG